MARMNWQLRSQFGRGSRSEMPDALHRHNEAAHARMAERQERWSKTMFMTTLMRKEELTRVERRVNAFTEIRRQPGIPESLFA
jgi:hypothetical protein